MQDPRANLNRNVDPALAPEVMSQISRLLAGLRFGAIEITVHDGRVVQIERREKIRIASPESPRAAG
ncbi:MAG: YezD family protein [Candidatus Macondimonas sp.]|mgnify:CR=1 FL=1